MVCYMEVVKCFGDHKININKANNGEIIFCGKDVANALGYANTNHAIITHVEDEDKIMVKKASVNLTSRNATPSQNRSYTYITECGVYSLIFSSKKENAKRFKRWVFHDVLPSLRKAGIL